MKTDLQTRVTELERLIAAWAEEKNILKLGEVIEVQVSIKKPAKVTARIEGYNGITDVDSIKIGDLGLSVRAYNGLANGHLQTVGQVRAKTVDEMLKIQYFGKKSLVEINEKLLELGVDTGWVIPPSNLVKTHPIR